MPESLYYCLVPADEVIERVQIFQKNVSRLPDVGLDEITSSHLFLDLWEDHIKTRRRWYELTQMLKNAGWERIRKRALFFIDGEYINRTGSRWFPPTHTQD
jgi:hypothetical protein